MRTRVDERISRSVHTHNTRHLFPDRQHLQHNVTQGSGLFIDSLWGFMSLQCLLPAPHYIILSCSALHSPFKVESKELFMVNLAYIAEHVDAMYQNIVKMKSYKRLKLPGSHNRNINSSRHPPISKLTTLLQ